MMSATTVAIVLAALLFKEDIFLKNFVLSRSLFHYVNVKYIYTYAEEARKEVTRNTP